MDRNPVMIVFPTAALTVSKVMEAIEHYVCMKPNEIAEAEKIDMEVDNAGIVDLYDCVAYDASGKFCFVKDNDMRGTFEYLKSQLIDQGCPFDEFDQGNGEDSTPVVRFFRPSLGRVVSFHTDIEFNALESADLIWDIRRKMREGELGIGHALNLIDQMPSCIYRDSPLSMYE